MSQRGANGSGAEPAATMGQSVFGGPEDLAARIAMEARDLVEDLTFQHVRRWKERTGGLAVGYLPVWVPRPLFEAIGVLPVGIFGGGEQLDVVRGDSMFQSYICHLPRSVVELGLSGRLDVLDGMLFPNTCDVIRNLSGIWRLMGEREDGRRQWVAYLDLPMNFAPQVGGRFFAHELRRLATELTERGASPLRDEALAEAIERENRRIALLQKLQALRVEGGGRTRASEAYLLVRAGTLLPAEEHIELLERYLAAAEARPRRSYDQVRVLLVGAFCEQPPFGLLRTLERAGCEVVFDDLQAGSMLVQRPIELGGRDPVEALARAWLHTDMPIASRFASPEERAEWVLRMVRASRADGVVFATPSFCDPALLDQPMLTTALEREKVPFTTFKYAENSAQYRAIDEQAGAFSDAVKLWGANA